MAPHVSTHKLIFTLILLISISEESTKKKIKKSQATEFESEQHW